MKAVIISGGKAPSQTIVEEEIEKSDLVICADSGGNAACLYGFVPDYLVGDFDSLSEEAMEYLKNSGCRIEKYPAEKDATDTEIALELAASLGAHSITLLGCTGSRIDHLLGNLGMLKKCLHLNISACIRDDNNTIFLSDRNMVLEGNAGSFFSLAAYCEKVEKLTIEGAKYRLREYDLKLGDSRTVSNEFLEGPVKITFASGLLMVILSRD